jgi:hypothetical protein
MGPARFLTEGQWLGWLATRLGMSVSDVLSRVDLDALAVAMQAPLRVPRDTRSERQHLVAQLAVQLSLMVSNPPFAPNCRRIAFDTLDLVCGLNGARLKLTDRERTQLAGEGNRPPASLAVLEQWVQDNLMQLTGHEKVALQVQTTDGLAPPLEGRPVFFISVEHTQLDADEREQLAGVVAELRRMIDPLVRELITSWPDRDSTDEETGDEPSASDCPGSVELWVPAIDHSWWCAEDTCRYNRRHLWRTCAHITLAPHGGSQGTGEEGMATPLDCRHLVIQWGDEPTSAVIEGNFAARPLTAIRVADTTRIVAAIEAWVRAEWPLIALAWQQTEHRARQLAPLADAFARALEPLGPEQRSTAMALAGLDIRVLDALTDPHGLDWLGAQAWSKAAAAMGFSAAAFHARIDDPSLSSEQVAALLTAVAKLRLEDREARALAAEAVRQKALGILRFALVWYPDWFDFREQLRADFDWPW